VSIGFESTTASVDGDLGEPLGHPESCLLDAATEVPGEERLEAAQSAVP
jgi:hypothetical protein